MNSYRLITKLFFWSDTQLQNCKLNDIYTKNNINTIVEKERARRARESGKWCIQERWVRHFVEHLEDSDLLPLLIRRRRRRQNPRTPSIGGLHHPTRRRSRRPADKTHWTLVSVCACHFRFGRGILQSLASFTSFISYRYKNVDGLSREFVVRLGTGYQCSVSLLKRTETMWGQWISRVFLLWKLISLLLCSWGLTWNTFWN